MNEQDNSNNKITIGKQYALFIAIDNYRFCPPLPQNAGYDIDEQENWLPNQQIRGLISKLKVHHIFLLSDACFAGDILNINRGIGLTPKSGIEYYKKQRSYNIWFQ
jgi:hypothetical protein